MEELDISPAFLHIFEKINYYLELLPFLRVFHEKKSKKNIQKDIVDLDINFEKLSNQLNVIESTLTELEDEINKQSEFIKNDFIEKNTDLDKLEQHLIYIKKELNKKNNKINIEIENDFNNLNIKQISPFSKEKITDIRQDIPKVFNSNLPKKKFDEIIPEPLKIKNKHLANKTSKLKDEKINEDYIYKNFPTIEYISIREYNIIPQYMKGRLKFEIFNKLVDEFNKTISEKYKFMIIPDSKYSNKDSLKYALYKQQEDEDTKGFFFCTPEDLNNYSELKWSLNNTKIFLTCLRHCKRIKEIRGKNKLIRYAILT